MQSKRRLVEGEYSFKPFDDTSTIFIHIPKAAGISVCRALYGNLAGGHTSVRKYQYVFSAEQFEHYFKFTFVRNPWDRLHSAYAFLRRGGFNERDRAWYRANIEQHRSFEAFVLKWLTRRRARSYIHFIPQTDLLFLPGTKVIPVDFLGLFENINDDFAHVARHMKKAVSLPHLNKTADQGSSYLDAYTDEMMSAVADVYEQDIHALGYTFDNSSLARQLEERSASSSEGSYRRGK